MSALAEALVAAQRRALQSVEKAYVAGQLDGEAATDYSDTDAQTEQAEAARWATESHADGPEA